MSSRSFRRAALPVLGLAVLLLSSSGCVTKRTVTEGGQVTQENYVVKRPVKKALQGLEFE